MGAGARRVTGARTAGRGCVLTWFGQTPYSRAVLRSAAGRPAGATDRRETGCDNAFVAAEPPAGVARGFRVEAHNILLHTPVKRCASTRPPRGSRSLGTTPALPTSATQGRGYSPAPTRLRAHTLHSNLRAHEHDLARLLQLSRPGTRHGMGSLREEGTDGRRAAIGRRLSDGVGDLRPQPAPSTRADFSRTRSGFALRRARETAAPGAPKLTEIAARAARRPAGAWRTARSGSSSGCFS